MQLRPEVRPVLGSKLVGTVVGGRTFTGRGCPYCRPTNSFKALKDENARVEKILKSVHVRQLSQKNCVGSLLFMIHGDSQLLLTAD